MTNEWVDLDPKTRKDTQWTPGTTPKDAGLTLTHASQPSAVPAKLEPTASAPAATGTAQWRKQRPLFSGVLAYFPDALLEVAYCSWVGNEQHNPGQYLHWAKEKSTDEADALMRHLKDHGTLDSDGVRHSAKVAWRALALLQREIEKEKAGG